MLGAHFSRSYTGLSCQTDRASTVCHIGSHGTPKQTHPSGAQQLEGRFANDKGGARQPKKMVFAMPICNLFHIFASKRGQ